jgi:hypothetical protein
METPFINLEYIFFKIYDFFGMVFGGGSGNNGFGPVRSGKSFTQWLIDFFSVTANIIWVIIIISFLLFFCIAIYVRLNVKDLDDARKKKYKEHFIKPAPRVIEKKNARWAHIESLFASHNKNDWRVAIIEADTMLDELVESLNFPGKNLGERLKNANTRIFPTLQSAWEAHKVRNKIAHEGINFNISEREAHMTKKHFEFIFKDMNII